MTEEPTITRRIVVSAVTAPVMAGMYYYQHSYSRRVIRLESEKWPSLEEQKKVEDSVGTGESNFIEDGDGVEHVTSETRPERPLEDPKQGYNHYLTKEEAGKRSSNISKITLLRK